MYTRWPCIVCGGSTDKDSVNAVFYENGEPLFVCARCLDDPDGTKGRLEEHANRLEGNAAWLREKAGIRWVLPTREAYDEANREADEWLDDA